MPKIKNSQGKLKTQEQKHDQTIQYIVLSFSPNSA